MLRILTVFLVFLSMVGIGRAQQITRKTILYDTSILQLDHGVSDKFIVTEAEDVAFDINITGMSGPGSSTVNVTLLQSLDGTNFTESGYAGQYEFTENTSKTYPAVFAPAAKALQMEVSSTTQAVSVTINMSARKQVVR